MSAAGKWARLVEASTYIRCLILQGATFSENGTPDDQASWSDLQDFGAALVDLTPAEVALADGAEEMETALVELVAEFDADDAKAAGAPGVMGLNETGGIILARAALRAAGRGKE